MILTPWGLRGRHAVLLRNSLHAVKTSKVTNLRAPFLNAPSARARRAHRVQSRFSPTGNVIPGKGSIAVIDCDIGRGLEV